eukprot:m51a1_g1560 putative eukaryotic translation initiation factor (597) ;mRNA; r:33821-36194
MSEVPAARTVSPQAQSANSPPPGAKSSRSPAPASSPTPAATAPGPRQQFTVISRQGSETFWWDASSAPQPVEQLTFKDAVRAEYSRDGSLLAVVRQKQVVVTNTDTLETVCTIEHPGVTRVSVSPLGTFVVTWERMNESEEPNLLVWKVSDVSAPVAKFSKKIPPNPDQWPAIRWTSDEALAARLVNDGVEFFEGHTMRSERSHISAPGLTQFAWSPVVQPATGNHQQGQQAARMTESDLAALASGSQPQNQGPKYQVAVFVAERKGEMASVSIYEWPRVGNNEFVSRRKFLQAQYCTLEWSPAGGVLLANASTDMDPTGKSYYGQSCAYILFTKKPESNGTVALKKEGGIHDMAWSPKGDMFAIVYGFMPAMTSIFSVTATSYTPKADVGPLGRNTALFSPDGTCLYVAGFQNLAGDMDFFTTKGFEKIGGAQAHTSTSWAWSPDSNYVACAICAPRRRVDNGYRFFDSNGAQVLRVEVPELYEFLWRPEAASKFPPSKASHFKTQKKGETAAAPVVPAAPAKYRHPNATGWALRDQGEQGGVTVYGRGQQRAAGAAGAAQQSPRAQAAARSLPPGCVYVEEKPKRNQRKKPQAP